MELEKITYDDVANNVGDIFAADEINQIKRVVNAAVTLLASLRTPIPIATDDLDVNGDLVIDWQNDPVPGDVANRTYVQRFGNEFNDVKGYSLEVGNIYRPYVPYAEFTMDGDDITFVVISNLLTGKFSIL